MLVTNARVAHFAWHTKSCDRPGRTNACVTIRTSPLSTPFLHSLQIARLVGAIPIEYVLGRVLKPCVCAIVHSRPSTQLEAASESIHQSFGSTSAIVT